MKHILNKHTQTVVKAPLSRVSVKLVSLGHQRRAMWLHTHTDYLICASIAFILSA